MGHGKRKCVKYVIKWDDAEMLIVVYYTADHGYMFHIYEVSAVQIVFHGLPQSHLANASVVF
jgi:hypothetical protein